MNEGPAYESTEQLIAKINANDPNYTNVNLSTRGIAGHDTPLLANALARNSVVTELNITMNAIDNSMGLDLLRGIAANSSLKKLIVGDNSLSEGFLKLLDKVCRDKGIDLDVVFHHTPGRQMPHNSANFFEKIANNDPNIPFAHINGTMFDMKELVKALGGNTHLKALEIDDPNFDDEMGRRLLQAIKDNTGLQVLVVKEGPTFKLQEDLRRQLEQACREKGIEMHVNPEIEVQAKPSTRP